MPVETDEVDGAEVVSIKVLPNRAPQQPSNHAHTAQNVDSVNSRHHVVDAEEHARDPFRFGVSVSRSDFRLRCFLVAGMVVH